MSFISSPARVLLALISIAVINTAWAEWTEDAEQCAVIVDDHDLAIHHCTRAIRSGRLNKDGLARTYANRAYEYEAMGEYENALDDAVQATEVDESIPEPWSQLGRAHSSMGAYRECINAYEKALTRIYNLGVGEPEVVYRVTIYLNTGWCSEELGDESAARWYYGKAFELDPDNPWGLERVYSQYGFL